MRLGWCVRVGQHLDGRRPVRVGRQVGGHRRVRVGRQVEQLVSPLLGLRLPFGLSAVWDYRDIVRGWRKRRVFVRSGVEKRRDYLLV